MIRLQRVGRRNHAEFRVVATEHTKGPKAGSTIEFLGTYNPHTNEVVLKKDRILHWLSVGAQASDTLHNLLVREGVVEGKKRNVLPKKTALEKAPEEPAAAEAPKEDAAPASEGEEATETTDAPETEVAEEEKKEEAPAEVAEEEEVKAAA